MARARKNPVEGLNHVLASLMALQRHAHVAHWEASGPNSYSDHLLFERIYDETTALIDPLAELMKGHGVTVLGAVPLAGAMYAYRKPGVAAVHNLVRATKLHAASVQGASTGVQNYLDDLAQQLDTFVYLLTQRGGDTIARTNGGQTFVFVKPFHLTEETWRHGLNVLGMRMRALGYLVSRRLTTEGDEDAVALTAHTPKGVPERDPRAKPIGWEDLHALGLVGDYWKSGTKAAPPAQKRTRRAPAPTLARKKQAPRSKSKPRNKATTRDYREARHLRGKANPSAKANGGQAPAGDGLVLTSARGEEVVVKASKYQWRRKSDWWIYVIKEAREETVRWKNGSVRLTRDGKTRIMTLEEFRALTKGSTLNWRNVRNNGKKKAPKPRNWTVVAARKRNGGPMKNKALRGSGKGKGKAARHPKHKGDK